MSETFPLAEYAARDGAPPGATLGNAAPMNHHVFTIPDLARLLGQRKLALLISGLLAGVLAVFVALVTSPDYVATGSILIQTGQPQFPQLILLSTPAQTPTTRNQTEADTLRSRALVEAMVQRLGLQEVPDFAAGAGPSRTARVLTVTLRQVADAVGGTLGAQIAGLLPPIVEPDGNARLAAAVAAVQRNLQISENENSHVLTVSYTASSPAIAAAIINTLFATYIQDEVSARRATMLQANQWLTERAAVFQREVEAADRAVERFRNENPLFELSLGSLASLQLSNQESALAAARQDLAHAQAALANAQRTGFKQALSSATIQQLLDREAAAAQALAVLAHRLGTHHPDYIAAENSLQEIRREIEDETGKVITSLERNVADATSRVADLEARVAESQVAAKRAVATAAELNRLTREADAKRRLYDAFTSRAAETQPSSAEFASARVISPAIDPTKPDTPPLSVVAAFGALAGGFAAAALCILRYLQKGGFQSVRELMAETGLPCLGALPVLPRHGRPRTRLLHGGGRIGAIETLRAMRFEIQSRASAPGEGGAVVLVTSSEVGDGKTTLAVALARLCAADGLRVLLVETDLRRPRVAAALGLRPEPALESAVAGHVVLADTVQVDPKTGLHCLTGTGRAVSPQKLFRSPGFATLLASARTAYDLVLLDSSPVLHVVDPLVLAVASDVILFAARWDRPPRALVLEALRRLPDTIRNRVVMVLTRVPHSRLDRGDYYAGYRSLSLLGPGAVNLISSRR